MTHFALLQRQGLPYTTRMIRRAGTLGQAAEYDVCIVGAGPAGIVLAAELAYAGLKISVLESGGFRRSAFADALRAVEADGLPIRVDSRERIFGGTSATWAGGCALLDPIDFLKRPLQGHEGWQIGPRDVAPYLERAAARYGFPPPRMFEASDGHAPEWRSLQEKIFVGLRGSTPRFGKKFRYLFDRDAIDLITHATVVALSSAPAKKGALRRVESALVRTHDGKEEHFRARVFVLACGGIENPRILLNSEGDKGSSLGNEYDQVGRYFMNRPRVSVGSLRFFPGARDRERYFGRMQGRYLQLVGLRLSEALQRETGALNCYLRLEPRFLQALEVARARAFAGEAISYARSLKRMVWRDLVIGMSNLARATPSVVASLSHFFYLLAVRVSYGVHPVARSARVRCTVEMTPRAENRVELADGRDALGARLPRVRANLSDEELRSIDVLLEHFDKECVRLRIGEFVRSSGDFSSRIAADVVAADGAHHLGATRMGVDPRSSVVNQDLRVHSVENLYVAGGSVFPTAGCANPTMMIVALSIRLAEHLRALFAVRPKPQQSASKGRSVFIIGSGSRVSTDVIPAFEALAGTFTVTGIFARTPGVVFGHLGQYTVRSLETLVADDVARASLVYVAVPPKSVVECLRALVLHNCIHLDLVIDTPVDRSRAARSMYRCFRSIHVAEDSVFLPWLDLIPSAFSERSPLGPIQRIECTRSVYPLHGIALIKMLASPNAGSRCGVIRRAFRRGDRVSLACCGGIRATMTRSRDYAIGHITIFGSRGKVGDIRSNGVLPIECIRSESRCTGFRLEKEQIHLSPEESDLVGPWTPQDTIVTRMREIKRVGLYRLLHALSRSEPTWSLDDGANDARIDSALRGLRVFFSFSAYLRRKSVILLGTVQRYQGVTGSTVPKR
jgi:choline dehydrogenase-like flavoprotein